MLHETRPRSGRLDGVRCDRCPAQFELAALDYPSARETLTEARWYEAARAGVRAARRLWWCPACNPMLRPAAKTYGGESLCGRRVTRREG